MKFNELKCGITGHTGILGRELLKKNKNLKFVKFKGDITKKVISKNGYKKILLILLYT